jgi:molybdopterin molybdotransferase
MISVNDAFTILDAVPIALKQHVVPLWEARNCVLAEDIVSPIGMPPFRQSNMDGFAIALHDSKVYRIVDEIKAGDGNLITLKPGEAAKIFTGAAVPDSAQAVIPIEKVTVDGNQLTLHESMLPEMNVRQKGSQIKKNDTALEKGAFLNAAAIGFLAGLGITSVSIYQKPKIGIVITGNELIQPGTKLPYGKVYESNAIMLRAALDNSDFDEVLLYAVNDTLEDTKATFEKAISENNVVLVSGGISVGDYDFTGRALQNLGVETLFYKVNQKPGKPLFAGKTNDKIVFALPGNPAAALTCFYIHVRPFLQKLSGMKTQFDSLTEKILAHDYQVNNSREQFLKASITNGLVTILPHQDSSMLDSFALANALVFLPNGNYAKSKGEKITVYPI